MKYRYIIATILVVAAFASCRNSEERIISADTDRTGLAVFTIPQTEDSMDKSRTHAASGTLVWSETDTVGIFPDSGSQIYFSMKSGAGESTAEFDGGGWRLKPQTEYWSYYPFCASPVLDSKFIPYSVKGQSQAENGVRVHDGFDCLYAKAVTGNDYSVNFNYTRLCCFLHIVLSGIEGTFTEAGLMADTEVFPVAGTYDIKSEQPSISVTGYSDVISMSLDEFTVSQTGSLDLYMAFIPCDLTSSPFTVYARRDDGKVFSFSKTASKAYEAGKTYKISSSELDEDPDAFFLSQDAYGLYDLASSTPICVYEPGVDTYSCVSRLGDKIFRLMNYSLDDSQYKFLSVRLSAPASGAFDGSAYVYAPSMETYTGETYNVNLLRNDPDGTCWFKDSGAKLGFIVKLQN